MYVRSQTTQWSVRKIGVLRPCIDRVCIVSAASVGALKHLLPIRDLESASHSFEVLRYQRQHPWLRSRINIVGADNAIPWQILAAHESQLRQYSITLVEIAYDVHASSIEQAREIQRALVKRLGKFRHQLRHVRVVQKPYVDPPPGCTAEPTFYLEDRKARVGLKCYIRRAKLPGGAFGQLCVRLEWTLTYKPTLTRYLNGNQIQDLLALDLDSFLARNIRLEEVDYVALGNVLRRHRIISKAAPGTNIFGPESYDRPDYRAWRAAHLILRRLAYEEVDRAGADRDWDLAITVAHSPAYIRAYCRKLRDKDQRAKRGDKKKRYLVSRTAITDYRIHQCFDPVQLIPTAAHAV